MVLISYRNKRYNFLTDRLNHFYHGRDRYYVWELQSL